MGDIICSTVEYSSNWRDWWKIATNRKKIHHEQLTSSFSESGIVEVNKDELNVAIHKAQCSLAYSAVVIDENNQRNRLQSFEFVALH